MTHSLGIPVSGAPCPFPEKISFDGRYARLEPLGLEHVEDLWRSADGADASFTYLRYGPFPTKDLLARHVLDLASRTDQPFWTVRTGGDGAARGWLSLCDIYPADAAIEIGSVWFSPTLQRTRAATEAIFLLMAYAFEDLGYRRLVWRCQAQNEPSRRAALRYGFVPEGIWRAAAVVKGWQRDVAWHSMLADEWPAHRRAIAAWLDAKNFTADGRPLAPLSSFRRT